MPTILRASILIATTTAIGVSVLSVGNPMTLFADVTASLVDNSRLQPSIDHSTPTIQSIADSQALPVPVGNSILLATDIESGDAPALCERFVA